jgi:hypothetical protein
MTAAVTASGSVATIGGQLRAAGWAAASVAAAAAAEVQELRLPNRASSSVQVRHEPLLGCIVNCV